MDNATATALACLAVFEFPIFVYCASQKQLTDLEDADLALMEADMDEDDDRIM